MFPQPPPPTPPLTVTVVNLMSEIGIINCTDNTVLDTINREDTEDSKL